MPIPISDLVETFGSAAERGSGALFVGAGLSQAAGLPGWLDLIDEPRRKTGVPEMTDAPLMAQYIADSPSMGRGALNTHVLQEITKVDPRRPAPVHHLVAKLGVREIWTTNYDQLLETACADAVTIFDEDHVHDAGSKPKTIIKMHGSIRYGDPATWDAPPILTREDYERYEDEHRRMWTMLQAVYLSRTILFIGFSFTDPNVELLQKLARRYRMTTGNKHLAIMRPPPEPDKLAHYTLQRDDLERSGIRIAEIADHDDLAGVFSSLVVRTRRPKVFVSGSETGNDFAKHCEQMSAKLEAEPTWEIASLGGPAGWFTSKQLATLLAARGRYDASHIEFYFRSKNSPPPPMDARVGTAIYTDLERDVLVPSVLDRCRAMLVIGGGSRTMEEIEWAQARGVGVVPLAASGGTAQAYFESVRHSPPWLGASAVDPGRWERLADPNLGVACSAAMDLLRQAMYYPHS